MGEPIFSLKGRVYWSETDAAQIAHFTSFLRYCEKTEEEFVISSIGRSSFPPPILFPRVHVEIDYHTPLRVHDEYRVDIVDIRLGRKSITWIYEIVNLTLGAKAADCKIVTVAFNPKSWSAIEIPEEVRAGLESAIQRSKKKALGMPSRP